MNKTDKDLGRETMRERERGRQNKKRGREIKVYKEGGIRKGQRHTDAKRNRFGEQERTTEVQVETDRDKEKQRNHSHTSN